MLLGLSLVVVSHPPPIGPVGLACFAGAVLVLYRSQQGRCVADGANRVAQNDVRSERVEPIRAVRSIESERVEAASTRACSGRSAGARAASRETSACRPLRSRRRRTFRLLLGEEGTTDANVPGSVRLLECG